MNRAFVTENDGWNRCLFKMESCMMAGEDGYCLLERCIQDPGFLPPKKPEQSPPPAAK